MDTEIVERLRKLLRKECADMIDRACSGLLADLQESRRAGRAKQAYTYGKKAPKLIQIRDSDMDKISGLHLCAICNRRFRWKPLYGGSGFPTLPATICSQECMKIHLKESHD